MSHQKKAAERPPDPERVRSALSAIPAHDRDLWLHMSMAVKAGLGEAGFPLWDVWSQSAENYKDQDARDVWKSINAQGGIGIGTLFHVAKEHGWQDDSKRTVEDRNTQNGALNSPPIPTPTQDLDDGKNAKKVLVMFESYAEATVEHPYIAKKKGSPEGLRVVQNKQPHAGTLAIPIYDINDHIQSIQFIGPDGQKKNLSGAPKAGGMFTAGKLDPRGRVHIVEGIGQAWSCNQATGKASVCAFGSDNVEKVARALAKKYPQAELVLVPDVGMEDKSRKLAKSLDCWLVTLPENEKSNFDANDLAVRYGTSKLGELLSKAEQQTRYKLLSGDDLDAMPPIQWRVKGIFPQKGLAAIFGPSGSGKSFLAFDLACAIARGGEWFGYKITACPVVYVALEGQAGFKTRKQAWEQYTGAKLPQHFSMIMKPFNVTEDAEDLIKVIPRGAVVIVDTLARTAPGKDENSSRDMGEIVDSADALGRKIDGLVILVHHTGKDAERGPRGSSALRAALDAAIVVNKTNESHTWGTDKVKDGRDDIKRGFELKVYDLGQDEDGDRITSCAINPVEIQPKTKKMTASQKLAERTFWEAVKKVHAQEDDEGNVWLCIDDWRPVYYSNSTHDNEDTKRKAFNRARASLQDSGRLEVKDDAYRFIDPDAGAQAGHNLLYKASKDKLQEGKKQGELRAQQSGTKAQKQAKPELSRAIA